MGSTISAYCLGGVIDEFHEHYMKAMIPRKDLSEPPFKFKSSSSRGQQADMSPLTNASSSAHVLKILSPAVQNFNDNLTATENEMFTESEMLNENGNEGASPHRGELSLQELKEGLDANSALEDEENYYDNPKVIEKINSCPETDTGYVNATTKSVMTITKSGHLMEIKPEGMPGDTLRFRKFQVDAVKEEDEEGDLYRQAGQNSNGTTSSG